MLSEVAAPSANEGSSDRAVLRICPPMHGANREVKLYSRGLVSVFDFCQDLGVLRMHGLPYWSAFVHFLL